MNQPQKMSPIAGGISNLCVDFSYYSRNKSDSGRYSTYTVECALKDAKRMAFALEKLEVLCTDPQQLEIIKDALSNREAVFNPTKI